MEVYGGRGRCVGGVRVWWDGWRNVVGGKVYGGRGGGVWERWRSVMGRVSCLVGGVKVSVEGVVCGKE